MKPAALIVIIAILSMASLAGAAKTVTNSSSSTNEQAVNGVAGPPPQAKNPRAEKAPARQPGRAALKKTKIANPPAMHDPN